MNSIVTKTATTHPKFNCLPQQHGTTTRTTTRHHHHQNNNKAPQPPEQQQGTSTNTRTTTWEQQQPNLHCLPHELVNILESKFQTFSKTNWRVILTVLFLPTLNWNIMLIFLLETFISSFLATTAQIKTWGSR